MSPQEAAFAAFAVLAALLTITPGVDSVLVLRTAVVAGRRTAMLAGFGVVSGLLAWACAAGLGVAAVLAASPSAYFVLRLAGAVFLAALGIRLLWRSVRGGQAEHLTMSESPVPAGRAYVQGLLTNLLNPKVGVFYVTLLPQFVVAGHSVLLVSLGLASVHMVEGVLWFLMVSWLAGRLGLVLRRRSTRRVLDAVAGTVLASLAVPLALDGRP